jgi:hypothetical protein
VQLAPAADGATGAPTAARTRDVSLLGMSVVTRSQLPWTQVSVLLSLPTRSEPISVKARVVYLRPCKEGGFDVGLAFV